MDNMLRSSTSVDIQIYALKVKQKPTADIFQGICKMLGQLLITVTFVVSVFYFFQGSYLLSHKTSFLFSTNFRIVELFNQDHVIHFYKPKKGLSSHVFTIGILVAETFGCYQATDVATDRGVGRGEMGAYGPPLYLSNQIRSKSFSFKHHVYCILRVFRNYIDQKFHDFYRLFYNIYTIYASFSFFQITKGKQITSRRTFWKDPILKIGLMKNFLLWTIRKEATMKESLNVGLQAESWTY